MIVSIMQPAYLPWLGYFHRLLLSDVHIVLDHVPASKGDFSNRNRVRTSAGWSWLTVPLLTKGERMTRPISEIEIDRKQRWNEKHWKTIELAYRRAPFFEAYAPAVREALLRDYAGLEDACREVMQPLLGALDVATPMRLSREMQTAARKSALVLELCEKAGATTYISGPFGREYLDRSAFAGAGIRVLFHDYAHPVYRQVYPGFEPYMAAIDLLFNCGPESRALLQRDQPPLAEV